MCYFHKLNRIEFLVTLSCTGRCKHCSEGDHLSGAGGIDPEIASLTVYRLCKKFKIQSLMTFGGEPLLFPETVCRIHSSAKEMGISQRQLITNGFFSKEDHRIKEVAENLGKSGVNNILLSVDAFHQETIPLEPVKKFAAAIKEVGVSVRVHPAWLKGANADNPYDKKTTELVREFESLGIFASKGNRIFPAGNALKYLHEYFDPNEDYKNPYRQDPEDIRSVCISPNGDVLNGNIYRSDILDILENYTPDLI